MNLFDSHAHVASPEFDADRAEVLARMRQAGVRGCMLVTDPCDEEPRIDEAIALAGQEPGVYVAVGVHPHNAARWTPAAEAQLCARLSHPACRALGEIGLDYHYDLSPRETQREVFAWQLDRAWERGLPAVLHIREAFGDAMELLFAARRAGRLPECQMHCFSGSWETAKQCLDMGMMISFSGSVTFKNANKLLESAIRTPLDRILVETDCPYLAPTPFRGRRNEPAYVEHTARRIAQLREMDPEAFAQAAYENACRFFHVPDN